MHVSSMMFGTLWTTKKRASRSMAEVVRGGRGWKENKHRQKGRRAVMQVNEGTKCLFELAKQPGVIAICLQ